MHMRKQGVVHDIGADKQQVRPAQFCGDQVSQRVRRHVHHVVINLRRMRCSQSEKAARA